MYTVQASQEFVADFEQIIDDILQNYTQAYAEKIALMLDSQLETLKQSPKIYTTAPFSKNYRRFIIDGKYTAFYKIDEQNHVVILLNIFPSIRDLEVLLK